MTGEQSKKLFASIVGTDETACRDRALIALLLSCGLRTIEVERANVGDIRNGFLHVQGKGRSDKTDKVRLDGRVENLLREYLNIRQAKPADPLFVSCSRSSKGERLKTCGIGFIVKKRLAAIGINDKRLTAHSLRHTAATNMLLAGESIENVSMILRHKSITTTQIYRHDISRMENYGETKAASAFL